MCFVTIRIHDRYKVSMVRRWHPILEHGFDHLWMSGATGVCIYAWVSMNIVGVLCDSVCVSIYVYDEGRARVFLYLENWSATTLVDRTVLGL